MFSCFLNSFSINLFFVLFSAILLSRLASALSKFAFATKFACAILALKISVANLSNPRVVIYLPWLWLLSLLSISLTLVS